MTDVEVEGQVVSVSAVEMPTASITLALPYDTGSVWLARRRLALDLGIFGIERDRIDDAVLVLSELLGNALRHARPLPPGMVEVSWTLQASEVEIAVTDGGGPTQPRALNLPVSALGGRGLAIVNDLSRTWGVRRHGRATTVYAIVPTLD